MLAQAIFDPASLRRSPAKAWARALEMTAHITRHPTRTLPVVLQELAEQIADSPALLSESETLDYGGLLERAQRYAGWAQTNGVGKGDVVCLLMPNRPEYMAVWLGVTAVGGVVALLNTNLAGPSLAHCVNVVSPKHVIVASSLADRFAAAIDHLTVSPAFWIQGTTGRDWKSIDEVLVTSRAEPFTDGTSSVTLDDRALYIYTSGTTGLPKAAAVSHARLMQWTHWFAGLMGTSPTDRQYNCLPMYHSVGGVLATGAVLVGGGSVVVRERFSTSEFWTDIARWHCTMFQYIGELCRYLLSAPFHQAEQEHRLRICCGNGLRPDVWTGFQTRFQIPQILEFYAATEGNVSLFNVDGKPGAIGRIPPFLAHRFPAALVRFDVETDMPVRGTDGRCIRCGVNEVGEAVGPLFRDAANVGSRFEGYTDARATEAKILRDVFAPGDAWFRTGDLMRQDEKGFFYFVDRIGDTFRWKGENVATAEVADAVGRFPGIREAIVYGVTIPGVDGRAGMASLVVDGQIDLAGLRAHLADALPGYARPMFLRIRTHLDVTGTFKHAKQELVRQGYDPRAISDPMYFNARDRGAYVPLDQALYELIRSGGVRL
jgi:fatty-acyl-CoA synthase